MDGFRAWVRARIPVDPPIDLRIAIDGGSDARIRYEGVAVPRGDIRTNRTGLCLMYPDTLAGRRIEALHDDARRSVSTFPRLIAPWPPLLGLRGLRHAYGTNGLAECRLDGDAFELEDQRNNADASYKVYNRSNLMPRPYGLRAGQAVRQSVELCLLRPSAGRRPAPAAAVASTPAPRHAAALGIGISASDACADAGRLDALARMRPAHLHLCLEDGIAAVDWAGIARLLHAARARLRLDLLQWDEAGANARLGALAVALSHAGIDPEALALLPSTPALVQAARRAFPGRTIGGGTRWFFTQLNRSEDLGEIDFLSFTTGSLVHGADDASVMAGLPSLPAMLQTLAARHPGRPVRVGPSAIGSRGSPLGVQPVCDGTRRQALATRDPRSQALFGAAWLIGHVAGLAGSGATALSTMHLSGDDGLITAQGRLCPAGCVLERLGGSAGVRALRTGWPERVAAVATADALLLANLGGEPVEVEVELPLRGRVELLDAASWDAHADGCRATPWRPLDPARSVVLPPYAIASMQAIAPA